MKKLLLIYNLLIFAFVFGQTPITDANFNQAISTCLSTNPIDGMCSESEYGAMPDWDVSNVTDMSYAFYDRADFNSDISAWDVSSVYDMQSMFRHTNAGAIGNTFNQPIGNWDVSSVTNMESMFFNAFYFNQPIGNWDVSNVTNMYRMFLRSYDFNQEISSWDVSNVTNMSNMFYEAYSFNQDLSSWCVTNITSEPTDFSTYAPLTDSNKPVWGTCPSLGVDHLNQLEISIYPNPTSKILNIDGLVVKDVVINSVLGKAVFKISNQNIIDVSSLSKGVYFLKVTDGIKISKIKFIKN